MPLLAETLILIALAYLIGVALGWLLFGGARRPLSWTRADPMLALIQFNLVPLGAALLIGIATGRWMFAPAAPRRRRKPRMQAVMSSTPPS